MVVHFFRNRSKERINFFELVDHYFVPLEHCSISSDEQEVSVKIDIPNFDCSYRYLITKRSRVSSIYKLNSDYVNINLLCEIPEVIPQFLIRLILKQMDDLCKQFELAIYYNQLDNIKDFNMFEMIAAMVKERELYFANHKEFIYYWMPEKKLNQICTYQTVMKELPDVVKSDAVVHPYIVMVNKYTGEVQLSINWQAGLPMIFPPYLNYVHVEEEENLISLIPAEVFMKHVEKLMYEIKDGSLDIKMLFLNDKNSIKAKKLLRKMRKNAISSGNFEMIRMIDLVEE